MKKDIKERWLNALRGDRYKQGTEALRPTEDTFCCLGVLADLVDPQGWSEFDDFCARHHNDHEILSEALMEKVGLRVSDHDHLAHLNDSGTPFEAIADYIEEHL